MNSSTIAVLLIFFMIILPLLHRRKMLMFQQQIRFTGSKERLQMMELAKRFLGKNCIIYYFDSQARGVITQVDDDAILIQTKRGEELLNLNFITRIMEYPSKK